MKTTETQTVFLHDNVTVPCKIPGSPHLNITIVGIIWSWKKERNESAASIYQFYGSYREATRPGANVSLLGLEWGDASLYLPRIELSDAGEYRCKLVVTPQQAEGTTRLDVVGESLTEVPGSSDGAEASGGCVDGQAEPGVRTWAKESGEGHGFQFCPLQRMPVGKRG